MGGSSGCVVNLVMKGGGAKCNCCLGVIYSVEGFDDETNILFIETYCHFVTQRLFDKRGEPLLRETVYGVWYSFFVA